MWTSQSRNHPSEHHSPLSSQPDIVVASATLGRADGQNPAAAALDVDREPAQAPFLDRTAGRHGARPTARPLPSAAPLIRPLPPGAGGPRNEFHVGAAGREPPVKP